jgi:hypothetical protein
MTRECHVLAGGAGGRSIGVAQFPPWNLVASGQTEEKIAA